MSSFQIPVDIDIDNQVLSTLKVANGTKVADVRFKIDTGCNIVVLNHDTLKDLGFGVTQQSIRKFITFIRKSPNAQSALSQYVLSSPKLSAHPLHALQCGEIILLILLYHQV